MVDFKRDASLWILLLFLFGLIAPLFLSDLLPLSWLFPLCVGIFVLSVYRKEYYFLLAFVVAFCLANWNLHQHQSLDELLFSHNSQNQKVQAYLQGDIVGLPMRTKTSVRFYFRVTQTSEGHRYLQNALLSLSCYRCPLSIQAGESWRFMVRLKPPSGYASWGAFDYEKYLFRKSVVATGYVLVRAKEPQSSMKIVQTTLSIDQKISVWREKIRNDLARILSEKQRALAMMCALTIGDKSYFTPEMYDNFRLTGVSHLMAISGLHVGLIFLLVQWLISFLVGLFAPSVFNRIPRPIIGLLPAWCAAVVYCALAGFAMPTVRALIMLSIYVSLKLMYREAHLLRVLLLAMIVILLYDAHAILDMGFWMSCSAVAVIGCMQAATDKLNLIKLQIGLWFGMMPINAYLFSSISIISPLVNLLLVPIFSLFLIPGALCLVFFLSVDWMRDVLVFFASLFEWIYSMLDYIAHAPISTVAANPLAIITVFVCAACLYYLPAWRKKLTVILICISFGFGMASVLTHRLAEQRFNIVLFDVGQGLSILLYKQDYAMLYDTGAAYASGFTPAAAVVLPYLRQHGIHTLDTLVVSHADKDHIGGLNAILEDVQVKTILTSRVDKIPQAQACQAGQVWREGELSFHMLSPSQDSPPGSNNTSCVIAMYSPYFSFLFSGDIEHEAEDYLLENGAELDFDVVFVPHQGSLTSSSEAFLNRMTPSLALVAAGFQNAYGHPHATVVQRYKNRGIAFYSTIESGSVLLQIDKNILKIRPYRQENKKFWFR